MYPHLLAASLTLLSGHIPSISGPSENLPTYVFQVRFPPRKHGVRGNECQKRSIVSVWYAQNSLPFCTEACYTTLTGCEDPTKMLMRVCILLQMQPAPLTGTATISLALMLAPPQDAARAPHGDSNGLVRVSLAPRIRDAARTPHGDSNWISSREWASSTAGCSPHPSRGQQLHRIATPNGSGLSMQPAPLTGTKKRETRNSSVSCLPFYISACSLTSLFHIAEEGYAGILCHSPCAAGFRCVLRGRRQLVYILSLYLSYVK